MTRDDYLAQLVALLPTGPAIPREPGGVLLRLLEAPAAELARVDLRGAALLDEADPRATAELLTDWQHAFGLPDACSPFESFSRASEATYFDGAGVLQTAGVDQRRPVFDPGGELTGTILIEPAGANEVPNPRFVGAVAGSPGTLPTGMSFVNGGVARASVATGTEAGMPFLDLRITGTTTVSEARRFTIIPAGSRPPASVADAGDWVGSLYLSLAANPGGAAPLARIEMRGWDGAGVVQNLSSADVAIGAGALQLNRRQFAVALTTPGIVSVDVALVLVHAAATTFDYTLRLGGPQMERGAAASSLILPPPATVARSTRAADLLRLAGVPERRDALLGRITGVGGQSRAYYTALAAALGYAITIAEPRPFRCGLSTCGQGLRDTAWAHSWIVYGSGEAERLFEIGRSAMGDALRSWGEALLECVIGRLAPAHTRVLFAYGPAELLLTDEFEALGTDGGALITP